MRLIEHLTKVDKNTRNLFLPAHGRGTGLPKDIRNLLKQRPGLWDLPELSEIGGPLEEGGAIADSQKSIAKRVGARRAWYGVNGATGLLQSALLSITKPGQAVLLPRNVHRSLIEACALGDLKPVLYDLPFMVDRGHCLPPNRSWIEEVLNDLNPVKAEIAAAVLVHPTYQGYAEDIKPIISLLHEEGWPVLVDEAHGAHFSSGLSGELPDSGLKAGADLIVHSLHKSAGGLTQTAVLWLQGNRVDPSSLERSLSWLQTTSPSSLLLASCESALKELHSSKGKRNLLHRLEEAKELTRRLRKEGMPLLENQDPLRLIWHCLNQGINGYEADAWLIKNGLTAELPERGCLTFCLGLSKHKGLEKFIKKRWERISLCLAKYDDIPVFTPPPFAKVSVPEMNLGLAWRAKSQKISLSTAVDRISSDLICPYPPGIPVLVPGEKLDRKRIDWLSEQTHLWPNQTDQKISVVANESNLLKSE